MVIIILIILFILLSYYEYKLGGKIQPIFKIIFTENLEPYYPPWCNDYKLILKKNKLEVNDIIPEFNNLEHYVANSFKLFYNNVNRYNFLICNAYGNLYAALKYIKNQNITSSIVLIEPSGNLGPLIHKITGIKIYYYSTKQSISITNCKYMGKLPTAKHLIKFRGYVLINFALWFSTRNIHEVYKNALFTAEYNQYLINAMSAPTYLCLYVATLEHKPFLIPQGIKKLIPFYYPGYAPLFLIEKPNNATHSSIFVAEDLSKTAINLHLFNYCMRNNTNFDLNYAKQVLSMYTQHKKTILETLGPLPPNTNYYFTPTDMTNFSYISGDYNSVPDLKIIDILNPPLTIKGNVVAEYGLLTLKRGIMDIKNIKYYNCSDYYTYLIGTGDFLLTFVPKALKGKPNITVVKNIQEAVKLSIDHEFIDNTFNNSKLIQCATENLKQHIKNIKPMPFIFTEYIPGLITILSNVFPHSKIITDINELSKINPDLITYWNVLD